jgi:hypothetical protein
LESFKSPRDISMTTLNSQLESSPAAALQVTRETKSRPLILDRLKDWQYLERSIHRLIAAWGRHFEDWDDKSAVHRHIWDQAEIVRKLRDRIEQFPGGDGDAPVSSKLERLVNAVLLAPGFEDAIEGIYEILARHMARIYIAYAQSAHPVHDAPTVDLLHDICAIKEQHWLWMRDYRRRHPHQIARPYQQAVADAWEACGKMAAALEVEGAGARPVGVGIEFGLPKFSARLSHWRAPYDINPYIRADFSHHVETRRLFWAIGYMMEKNLPDDQLRWIYWGHFMPWEFHYNVSRHLWDESRHGDSGYSRLKDFGICLEEVGFSPYNIGEMAGVEETIDLRIPGQPLDAKGLYDEVFFIGMVAEQGHFMVKNQSYQDFRDGEDLESAEMMLFDIIDETQHVQYAHRWLPVLADLAGIDNSDYKERAAARRKELQEEELSRIEQDRNMPRSSGSAAWNHYQNLLERVRTHCPLTNVDSAPERSPKPM